MAIDVGVSVDEDVVGGNCGNGWGAFSTVGADVMGVIGVAVDCVIVLGTGVIN